MLPSEYMPRALADKILFIGCAVCTLRHPNVAHLGLAQMSSGTSFARTLHTLREESIFDPRKVDLVVEQIRTEVMGQLADLVVTKAQLKEHLKALKDFILLGRGEFYQTFVEESQKMMSKKPGPKAGRRILLGPFQNAGSIVNINQDSNFRRIRFHMDTPSFDYREFKQKDFLNSESENEEHYGGLQCVGCTRRIGTEIQLISHLPAQAGAMWYCPRPCIGKGFTTSFNFRTVQSTIKPTQEKKKDTNIFRKGFAFVVQGESTQWYAVRGPNVEAERGKSTPPLFEYNYGALVIEFTARYNPAIREESHSVACYAVDPKKEKKKRVSPLYTVWCPAFFDGKSHKVKIEYTTKPSSLTVWLLPQEKHVLHITKKDLYACGVQLEAQRGWIGLMAATGDDMRWQSQAIHIESWKFEVKQEKHEIRTDPSSDQNIRQAWKALRMGYQVDSPLDLVLLEEGFDRYNALWHFLLHVKRVQLALKEAYLPFITLRKKKKKKNLFNN